MIAAILLAAGESTRMGRPKALLPWRDTTLVEYQVRELTAAGVERIAVVLGHDAGEVWPHVPDEAHMVVNEAYREGRASSLRAGAGALPDDADPILVLGVDQPRPRDELRAISCRSCGRPPRRPLGCAGCSPPTRRRCGRSRPLRPSSCSI